MANDFTTDNPNTPLDTWIEEEIPVKKVRFDHETGKTFTTTELEKVKTKYIDVPQEKLRCADGDHLFDVVDGSKGLFKCRNCPYHRQVYPTTYMYFNGRLIHKVTGKVV